MATIRVWRPTSLTFNSGDTEKSITFAATDDSVDDDGESVLLSFGTLPTERVSLTGSMTSATVNITDDDDAGGDGAAMRQAVVHCW